MNKYVKPEILFLFFCFFCLFQQVGQNHLKILPTFFDRRQGVILEEVGLGKIVESVREQVEGPVMLSDDDDRTWGNACLFVTFLFLMPSQSSCQSCNIGVKNILLATNKTASA